MAWYLIKQSDKFNSSLYDSICTAIDRQDCAVWVGGMPIISPLFHLLHWVHISHFR